MVGKTKKSKSEDKFYSDEEDEKEEGSDSSGSEDSSSSGGMFLRFKISTHRNANVVCSVGVQNQAARARMRRKAVKAQTSPPVILGRVPVPLKRAPVSLNLNKRGRGRLRRRPS